MINYEELKLPRTRAHTMGHLDMHLGCGPSIFINRTKSSMKLHFHEKLLGCLQPYRVKLSHGSIRLQYRFVSKSSRKTIVQIKLHSPKIATKYVESLPIL